MTDLQTLIVLYLLFVVPLLARWFILLGANIYRAGETKSAPPKLLDLTLPRFKVGASTNGKAERHESERLPEV